MSPCRFKMVSWKFCIHHDMTVMKIIILVGPGQISNLWTNISALHWINGIVTSWSFDRICWWLRSWYTAELGTELKSPQRSRGRSRESTSLESSWQRTQVCHSFTSAYSGSQKICVFATHIFRRLRFRGRRPQKFIKYKNFISQSKRTLTEHSFTNCNEFSHNF